MHLSQTEHNRSALSFYKVLTETHWTTLEHSEGFANIAFTYPFLTLITYQGHYLSPQLSLSKPTALKPCVERRELCIIHLLCFFWLWWIKDYVRGWRSQVHCSKIKRPDKKKELVPPKKMNQRGTLCKVLICYFDHIGQFEVFLSNFCVWACSHKVMTSTSLCQWYLVTDGRRGSSLWPFGTETGWKILSHVFGWR